MNQHLCHAITDDTDGRRRWAHVWRTGDPTLRMVVCFYGHDEAAEQRAIKWAIARYWTEAGAGA